MDSFHDFTVNSKRSTFLIFLVIGCAFGLMTLALLFSLFKGDDPSDSLVTGSVFLFILTALFLWGADSSFRVMTCRGGLLTETRGRFFKKRTVAFDLKTTDRIQALFVSVRGIRHAYIQLFSHDRTFIVGPLYYTRKGRVHILEAIRPILQNPAIKKEGDFDRALKEYYNKYHPHFDQQANIIYIDQPASVM